MDFASADGEPGPSSRYTARANPFYAPADDDRPASEPLFGASAEEQASLQAGEADNL